MSSFGYYDEGAVLRKAEARFIAEPSARTPICGACRNLLEDCLRGVRSERGIKPSCVRCANCSARAGFCAEDCGESDHLVGCQFPQEPCGCRAIKLELSAKAADIVAEEGLEDHREERHS